MPKIELITRDEVMEIGDAECLFLVRRLSAEMLREIRRRHTRWVGEGPDRRLETDEDEVDQDLMDYVIQDWPRGVVLPDGSPAPCTREAKQALPGAVRLQLLAAAGAANTAGDEVTALKNLRPSSGKPAPGGGSTPAA